MAWSRSRYIPPHRANNGVSAFNGTAPSDGSTQYGFNPAAARPRGRGGGRFGGRWFCEIPDNRNNVDNLELVSGVENAGGINFDAYESAPVEATGNDIPPPVSTTFAETELEEGLKRNIVRCKYVKPTPIQRHAIPIVIAGRDLMACAQTGSGKTAAFCVPIISGILKGRSASGFSSMPRGGFVAYPTALILSPTRELSSQIHDEANKFAYQTGLKVVVAYGGAPITHQLRNLEKGVDILVATPGRLVDMIERGRVSLTRIKYLALDEADRMLDMGFEPQVRQIVEQMQMPPPGVRQTLLFSATFPTDIQKLASDFLSDYIFLAVGRVGSSTELIAQKIELVEDTDKRNHLMALLRSQMPRGANGKQPLTLVFVETKRGADNLQHWLSRNGFPAMSIHGDKVQMEREHALRSFKSGATPILVATDVASRGLDIPHVAHVINFDLPREIDGYVHRIGRTGRAGKSGLATAFFSDKNIPLAKALVGLLQEAKQEVPSWLSQYAECSSPSDCNHRPQRYGSGKYGGCDFRNVTKPEVENYSYFSTNGNADYAVQSQSYNTDTSFRNVTKPEVENYNYFSTNGNADYAVESNNTATSFDIINSNTGSSYDNPNAAFAGSYHYTDANTDLYGGGKVEEDGPCGYESIVATGWD